MRNSTRTTMSVVAASLALGGHALAQQQSPQEFVSNVNRFQEFDAADAAARAVAESSQSAQSAVTNRQFAPDPQAFAAGAGRSPMRVRLPGGGFQEIMPTTVEGPVDVTGLSLPPTSSGATISVPANARAGTTPLYVAPEYNVYDPGYSVVDPGYATTYEYETLIRAGRPPSYSITTLHSPYRPYRPYYSSPSYSVGLSYGTSSLYRYNAHNRPFSSGYKSGYSYGSSYGSRSHRSLGYDPLGGTLHRSAQLHFHEASRAPSAYQPRREVRTQPSRTTTGIREARPLRELSSNRDRGAPTRAASPSRGSRPERSAAPSRGGSQNRDTAGVRRSPK